MKEDVKAVKAIGEEIGYGHLMSIASSLWRAKMEDEGYPISGAFVPTCMPFLKKTHLKMHEDDAKHYDRYIK
jgi:hypothetical protein